MNLSPTAFHPFLAAKAIQNGSGKAFFVHLEHGDMTRYDFYIIPCLGQLRPEGYGLDPIGIWIFLAPINLQRRELREEPFISLSTVPEHMFFQVSNAYSNEWSVKVVSHYLALVCREIKE